MHSCTGPGCSVCADSMAGEELAQARAAAKAWRDLATVRAVLLVVHDPERSGGVEASDYAQALEDEERALEAVLKLPEEYRS